MKSCRFLTLGMTFLMLLGAGCVAEPPVRYSNGVLDMDELVADLGPRLLALDEFVQTDSRVVVAVKETAPSDSDSFDSKMFLRRLRSGLAQYGNGKVTFVLQSETSRWHRRRTGNTKVVVDVNKLAGIVAQEVLTVPYFPDRETVLAVLLPRDDKYPNVDSNTYLTALCKTLAAARQQQIRVLPPGKYEGADYILSSVFTKKNENVNSIRLLGNYFKNRGIDVKTEAEEDGQQADRATASRESDSGTKNLPARRPRFVRRSTIEEGRYGVISADKDATLATGLDLLLIDTQNRYFVLDQQHDLEEVMTAVSKEDYILTITVSDEIMGEDGKANHAVLLRLVNPNREDEALWEVKYITHIVSY